MVMASSRSFQILPFLLACFFVFLTCGAPAPAQTLHEEIEPNETPALAAILSGSIAIRGTFENGDRQDAFVWHVPKGFAKAPWTLKIDGLEESATLVWFFQLSYGDEERTQVLDQTNLARFGVRALEKTKTLDGLLFPEGEYLIGVTPLGGIEFSQALESAGSTDVLAAMGTSDSTLGSGDVVPFGTDRYDVSLVAGETQTWDEPESIEDDIARFKTRAGFNGVTDASEAEIWFSVDAKRAAQQLNIEGQGEIGAGLSYALETVDGQVLKKERVPGQQSFNLKHLVLDEGEYVIRLNSGRGDIGRFQINISAGGAAVEGEEAEPNDSATIANAIKVEEGIRGLGDRDYFSFQLGDVQTAWDIALTVEDEGSASLCLSDTVSTIQCVKGKGRVALPNLHLSEGDYTLEVRAEADRPYSVAFDEVEVAERRFEREPNDDARFAHDIGTSKAVRGAFDRPGDYDYISFDVEDPDVVYRIVVSGAQRVTLIDDLGHSLVERRSAVDGEFSFDNLDLLPGKYLLRLSGEDGASYRVIVRNLGEIPEDFEREPNDTLENALRLNFGEPRRGVLGGGDSADSYVFSLGGPDTVKLAVTTPNDQSLTVYLYRAHVKGSAEAQVAERERVEVGQTLEFVTDLHPGFYRISIAPNEALKAASPYSVSIGFAEHDGAHTDAEPNDWIGEAEAVPAGGQIVGHASGMGGEDWFIAPAPEAGSLVQSCDDRLTMYSGFTDSSYVPPEETLRNSQFLVHKVSEGRGGTFAFYVNSGSYACRLFLEGPSEFSLPNLGARLVGENETPLSIDQSQRVALSFSDYGERLRVKVPEAERFVRLICEAPTAGDDPGWGFDGGMGGQFTQALGGAYYVPFELEDPERVFSLNLPNSESYPAEAFCNVVLGSDFQPWPPQDDAPNWEIGDIVLEAGVGEAWSDSAQRMKGTVALSNTSDTTARVSLAPSTSGRAWRVENLPATVELPAGTTQKVPFSLVIPPGATALTPARVRIDAKERRFSSTAFSEPVQLDPNVNAIAPHSGFETPDALLGGIDVLNLSIGAKVVSENGTPVDDDATSPMADGRSAVVPTGKLPRESVFRLAGKMPPIRGFGFSLRLDSNPTYWAKRVAVDFSVDGQDWTDGAVVELDQRAERQFFVLDTAIPAQFLRVTVLSQFADIAHMELNEVLAIAEPGYSPHQEPLDLAAHEHGGHLVAGELPTAYAMLATNKAREVWLDESDPETSVAERHWIIGFHESRIARISGFEWLPGEGREKESQASEIKVSVSNDLLTPFQPISTLSEFGRTDLARPAFARFVKFTLPNEGLYLPNHIKIFEAPAADDYLSVFGQWTEDSSTGPFEHFGHGGENLEIAEHGGTDQATAEPLEIGNTLYSAVLHGETRWFELNAPEVHEGTIEFGLDGGSRLRQARLRVFEISGEEIELERTRIEKSEEEQHGVFATPNLDAMRLKLDVAPGGAYFVAVDVPSRVLSLRAENVAGVSARRVAMLRSLAEVARGFSESDAMRLLRNTAYTNSDGLVIGGRRILKALQSRPVEATGTSSFADAISQTAENFVNIDGAKSMIGFATGAIFNDQSDLQFADRLGETPVHFEAVLLSCNGLLGCPNERNASDFMRSAAVGSRGKFKRAYQIDDVEEAIAAAVARMSKPVPYRLSIRIGAPVEVTEEIDAEHAELLVLAEEGQAANDQQAAISIVLDASGSMLKRIPGSDKRRIEVARSSLSNLITDVLPAGAMMSYRAFGLEKDACDTRAFLPLAPLDKSAAVKAINDTPAINLAKTPIAASLSAASDDLSGHDGPKTVVLITDGEETCDGDVLAAIEKLRADGLQATLQIVGFAIDDEALKAEFSDWAKRGGGVYIDAADQVGLSSAITAAARGDYVVKNVEGERIAIGFYNEPLIVPAGRMLADLCEDAAELEFQMAVSKRLSVQLDSVCGP